MSQLIDATTELVDATVNTTEAPATTETNKVPVDAILTLLINGKSRKEIAEHFGMPKAVLNRMFSHPKLAGHRPKKASQWELVDGDETLNFPAPKAKKKEEAPVEDTSATA